MINSSWFASNKYLKQQTIMLVNVRLVPTSNRTAFGGHIILAENKV